ncbi:hypothetical protein F5ESL0225_05175 [Lactobacillus sp. ESL0225]|nr:hypothetical protein F5ESL0237_04805 [Lactobacillus sp. ESL0237]RMC43377.1 hypothetical protein F5ESL0234_04810 [Lactobacillus sp. ESL0234]RMC44289.1 hypothetical protein F5ESL0236_04815 [Lactobacillus sp. ESL0236]RMC49391.1 hypothetical protein F5ESL0225_05175 [Lactobacillus sp. ESL0225]
MPKAKLLDFKLSVRTLFTKILIVLENIEVMEDQISFNYLKFFYLFKLKFQKIVLKNHLPQFTCKNLKIKYVQN